MLGPIDWDGCTYKISGDVAVSVSPYSGLSRKKVILNVANLYEKATPFEHYVYALKYDDSDENGWYVGETGNLSDRMYTHCREKDIINIEQIEGVDPDSAKRREHDLHAEVILEKETTNVWGGH